MTDAIQSLFDEHDVISEAVDVAVHAEQLIATDADRYEEVVRSLLEFFRVYADGFHHHKEEEILFPEMSKKKRPAWRWCDKGDARKPSGFQRYAPRNREFSGAKELCEGAAKANGIH
ncbi:MAG: hypothetical protein UZ06_CHB003000133 [Chlorobi bacterium OLB6]|nr:MAG: hypothetical protein UZ06_CHB003000133 [Chlorobi bacterium OLB6]